MVPPDTPGTTSAAPMANPLAIKTRYFFMGRIYANGGA